MSASAIRSVNGVGLTVMICSAGGTERSVS